MSAPGPREGARERWRLHALFQNGAKALTVLHGSRYDRR